jgi:hypothetical protein
VKRQFLAAAISCFALAAPAAAEMSVATFLDKADALKAKGVLAMMSSDIGLLQAEVKGVMAGYRAEIKASRAAGRPMHSCPPEKAAIDSDILVAHFRTVPAPQRTTTSVKTSVYALMKRRYPCPAR